MPSTPYLSRPHVQSYAVRAHRLRGAAFAGLIRNVARWLSAAAR